MSARAQDGSTRVLPELRDERQGLYRAVTQPGLEVQHATAVAGLDVRRSLPHTPVNAQPRAAHGRKKATSLT